MQSTVGCRKDGPNLISVMNRVDHIGDRRQRFNANQVLRIHVENAPDDVRDSSADTPCDASHRKRTHAIARELAQLPGVERESVVFICGENR
jgi:hypothetical protein